MDWELVVFLIGMMIVVVLGYIFIRIAVEPWVASRDWTYDKKKTINKDRHNEEL